MKDRLVLVVKAGAKPQSYRLIESNVVLGSDIQSTFVIRNPTVSRRHALLRRSLSGEWEIIDLDSTNGTFVNGRKIAGPTRLAPGDHLRLGAVTLELRHEESSDRESDGRGLEKIGALPRRAQRLGIIFVGTLLLTILLAHVLRKTLWGPTRRARDQYTPVATNSPELALPNSFRATPKSAATTSQVTTVNPSAIPHGEYTAPLTSEPWLARLNYYRTLAKVQPLMEATNLSEGDFNHARYLVKNYARAIRLDLSMGATMHREDPNNPWYTPSGARAAEHGDVEQWYDPEEGSGKDLTREVRNVDDWIRGPFHRLSILSPAVHEVGYGYYCEHHVCASTLELPVAGEELTKALQAVMFPGAGTVINLRTLARGEWPNPLASCPGYVQPAGLAITLQLGAIPSVVLQSHELTRAGHPVEHCAFDANTYVNPNPADQEWGRKVLAAFGAVVLIPRYPLQATASYHVLMVVNGQPYEWSFTVGNSK